METIKNKIFRGVELLCRINQIEIFEIKIIIELLIESLT